MTTYNNSSIVVGRIIVSDYTNCVGMVPTAFVSNLVKISRTEKKNEFTYT